MLLALRKAQFQEEALKLLLKTPASKNRSAMNPLEFTFSVALNFIIRVFLLYIRFFLIFSFESIKSINLAINYRMLTRPLHLGYLEHPQNILPKRLRLATIGAPHLGQTGASAVGIPALISGLFLIVFSMVP